MKQKLGIWLFVLAIVVVPFGVFGVVKWYERSYQHLPILGEQNHAVKNFSFTNQNGKSITLDTWDNKIVVAGYFFSHCSTICPKMMYQLKRLQAYANKDILIACFSVDPERDSVERLNKYAAQLGIEGNWSFLTGAKKELYRFARKDLLIVATDGDGGPDDFIHSENLVLLDKQHRIRGFYKGTDENEINILASDIEKLVNESQ